MGSLVAVWGLCDGTEILFDETSEDVWETTVPADLDDGEYVVEVWGKTRTDFIIYTTAILYLCDSRLVSLRFIDTDYLARFRAGRYGLIRRPDDFTLEMSEFVISVREKNRMEVIIRCA